MALDHDDPEDLQRAYERHETVKDAAQEFDASYDTVRRRMIEHGIHCRYGGSSASDGGSGQWVPAHTSEPEVFEVCWRFYRNGETDLLEAGVAPATIADELDTTAGLARSVLRWLQDQGVVVELHGLDPETRSARTSFAPAALVEDNGGERR